MFAFVLFILKQSLGNFFKLNKPYIIDNNVIDFSQVSFNILFPVFFIVIENRYISQGIIREIEYPPDILSTSHNLISNSCFLL